MTPTRYVFKPALLPTAAVIILLPVLISLGLWQLDRADQKQVLLEDFHGKRDRPPLNINRLSVRDAGFDEMIWRTAEVTGEYHPTTRVLLDNQVMGGAVGYLVYTPLLIDGTDRQLLVNRGWIAAGPYRDIIPDIANPAGEIRLVGTVKRPPATGMVLGDQIIENLPNNVYRVQRLEPDALGRVLDADFQPYTLRLEAFSEHGFTREWPEPGSGMERHLGYAFQWFALAALLLLIYVAVNLKRDHEIK